MKLFQIAIMIGLSSIGFCHADTRANQEAIYTFPTTTQLQPFATFNMADFRYSLQGNLIQIDYDLPQDLVGEAPVHVTLSGSNQTSPILLAGSLGTASCTSSQTLLTCDVNYSSLTVDENAVETFLTKTIADPAELKSRSSVARFFGGEPIGVITYILDAQSQVGF